MRNVPSEKSELGLVVCDVPLLLPVLTCAPVSYTHLDVYKRQPDDWEGFAEQMVAAVRPGGICVIIEHNHLNPVTRRSVRNCPFDADAVLVTPADARRVFRKAGAHTVAKWFVLFAPRGGHRTFQAEQCLSWLPLGGQFLYSARRS